MSPVGGVAVSGTMTCFVHLLSVKFICVLCAGSALILPSPAKPVVLPVSVMGQNTLGRVQVVSNQVTELYLKFLTCVFLSLLISP